MRFMVTNLPLESMIDVVYDRLHTIFLCRKITGKDFSHNLLTSPIGMNGIP